MLPKIFKNIIEWNNIANVSKSVQSMELYSNLITEEYKEFTTAFTENKEKGFEDYPCDFEVSGKNVVEKNELTIGKRKFSHEKGKFV